MKFIDGDGNWSECLSSGSSSRSSSSSSSSRTGGLETSLRFEDIFMTVRTAAVFGLTTSGDVYVWGSNAASFLPITTPRVLGRTPVKIDIPGNVKIAKIANVAGTGALFLGEDGELFMIGSDIPLPSSDPNTITTTSAFGGLLQRPGSSRTPVRITDLPNGETSIIDIGSDDRGATFLIGASGTAYYSGLFFYSSQSFANTIWQLTYTAFTNPTGVTGYRRIFTGEGANGSNDGIKVYFEGNDGNYYAFGAQRFGVLGSGFTVPTPYNILIPAIVPPNGQPVRVNFPANTVITKMDFIDRGVISLTEDGDAYFMGRTGMVINIMSDSRYNATPIADSDDSRIKSIPTSIVFETFYASEPLSVPKPEGVNSFVDIEFTSGGSDGAERLGLMAIGDNGKVYTYNLGGLIEVSPFINSIREDNDKSWEAEAVLLSALGDNQRKLELAINTGFIIDSEGLVHVFGGGDDSSNRTGTLGLREVLPIPVPMISGRHDSNNPNPEPASSSN